MKVSIRARPADSLTVVFLIVLISISIIFQSMLPNFRLLIGLYSVLLILQLFIISMPDIFSRNRFLDITRSLIFPTIFVLAIFDSLELIVHNINPEDIDPLLIRLDYALFGGHPTVMLEAFQHPLLTDILQIAYSSYYFLPLGLGLILKFNNRDADFDKALFYILLCFYLSYIGYMLFPALGPRFTISHLQGSELKGLFVTEALQELLNRLEGIKRDAFPSGHTGVALIVSVLAYRMSRAYFYYSLPVIILLILSTVYCRYHYVVDVIGGFLLTVVTLVIGRGYYVYCEGRKSINHRR